ncbi:MAG: recombination mediator RecR [Acidimicrobiales bacterium]
MGSPYTPAVQALIDEFGRLPGVGPRTAVRIALHLIRAQESDVARLTRAIAEGQKVRFCERCFNLADGQLCSICSDPKRDATKVCVVENSRDLAAIERTGEFRGTYHVLLGVMDPMAGVGHDDIKIRELVVRLQTEPIDEVIVCTGNNTEGDVTAAYIAKLMRPIGISVTRIASGLPVGSDLEFADELTLGRALENRRDVQQS